MKKKMLNDVEAGGMLSFVLRLGAPLLLVAAVTACSSDNSDSGDPPDTDPGPPVGAAPPNTSMGGPITDAVVLKLREVSPETEGSVWKFTDGNVLREGWLLDVPGCWGDPDCGTAEGDPLPDGLRRIVEDITRDISNAEHSVDISTQIELPTFEFKDAIIEGIKQAYDKGHEPTIRILAGAYAGATFYPFGEAAKDPFAYMDEILADLGPEYASKVKLIAAITMTASITTMFSTMSWNHSKVIAVDGKTNIAGGINWWGQDYFPPRTKTPMHDIDIRVEGPAAAHAVQFMDVLWEFICQVRDDREAKGKYGDINLKYFLMIAYSPAMNHVCPGTLATDKELPEPTGEGVGILSLGKLGIGLEVDDDGVGKPVKIPLARLNKFDHDLPSPPWPKPDFFRDGSCFYNPWDWFNAGQDVDEKGTSLYTYYDRWNPVVPAVVEFLRQAKESIFLSQLGIVFDKCKKRIPMPWFDARAMNVLADKMLDGVKVTLVESSLGAEVPGGGTYSMQDTLDWTLEALAARIIERAELRGLTEEDAKAAYCENFSYAPARYATWPDGSVVETWPHAALWPVPPDPPDKTWHKARSIQPGNHAKFWAIDRKAFVVGSYNAIPWNLQEYSYMIEDPAAVATMYEEYIDKFWKYSRLSAYQDPENGTACLWQPPMPMSESLDISAFPSLATDDDEDPVIPPLHGLPYYGAIDDLPCPGLPAGDWLQTCDLVLFNSEEGCITTAKCKDNDNKVQLRTSVAFCPEANNCDGELICTDSCL